MPSTFDTTPDVSPRRWHLPRAPKNRPSRGDAQFESVHPGSGVRSVSAGHHIAFARAGGGWNLVHWPPRDDLLDSDLRGVAGIIKTKSVSTSHSAPTKEVSHPCSFSSSIPTPT
eukprot:3293749-Rhodomonas_salina.4